MLTCFLFQGCFTARDFGADEAANVEDILCVFRDIRCAHMRRKIRCKMGGNGIRCPQNVLTYGYPA